MQQRHQKDHLSAEIEQQSLPKESLQILEYINEHGQITMSLAQELTSLLRTTV
ncbi:MAG: hypothetical protein COB08_004415 [Rhodobacteraceae bacterium]|nr:hypothetical protein [Paracoccaceae bacterium]